MKQTFISILIIGILGLYHLNAQQWGAYTLYSTQNSTSAYLVDTNGTTFHQWSFGSNAKTGYSSYLLPGGTIVRAVAKTGNSFNGGGVCGQIQKVDYNNNVLWSYVYSTSSYCSHHDLCWMPNGNVLLIAYESKTAAQVQQAGCSYNNTMWPDKIVEIHQTGATTGEVVWEWHVWDHLCQSLYPAKDNYVTSILEHPELLNINYNPQKDWMHVNGIDYNPQLDQIVFSAHNMNEIYVIDHSTTTAEAAGHTGGNSGKGGDFLYRWGNPAAYQASGTNVFHVVHDAHWIPEGCPNAGYLVAFNNNGVSNNQSTVDMINPPYDGYNYSHTPGTAYQPSTYTLRHLCNGHSNGQSSSQQLPNGNMHVCIAEAGFIYEVSPTNQLLWSKQLSGQAVQSFRYSECHVTGALSATASATPNQICSAGTSQLNVTATGGSSYSYSWTSNPVGFTSNIQNPLVSPTETTTYTATVSSDGCDATASVTVVVGTQPTVTASASPNAICSGESSQLNAVATGGTSYAYSWTSNPQGFTSNLQNPVVTPSVTTTYYVTVNSGGCTDEDAVTVTVNPAPTVNATASTSAICAGESVTLNAAASGGTNYTYSWTSNPPGFSSNLQNPVASPTVTTTYYVTVTSAGCSGTDFVTVTVNPVPSVTASASDTEICEGESVTLNAAASGGSNYSYSWTSDPPGFTSNLQNPSVVPTITTTYTVEVTSAGCTGSDFVMVTVFPVPEKPTITQNENTLVSSYETGNQWFFDGEPIENATGQIYTPTVTGWYQVQVTDENGCESSLSDAYYFTVTGVNQNAKTSQMRLFPNPTDGLLKIDQTFASGAQFSLTIYDPMGNTVYEENNPLSADFSAHEEGIYFYTIKTQHGELFTGKIILIKK